MANGGLERRVLSVIVPLGLAGLSYTLWWISHRLVMIGPLDRAAFGWSVVIPVWLAAPVAAGFVSRRLRWRESIVAAAVVAVTTSGAAAVRAWQTFAFPNCEFGVIRTPDQLIQPSLAFGAVVGSGLAVSTLAATWFARHGQAWKAVVAGAVTEFVMVLAAILAAGPLFQSGCQRPTI
jgi:hypothetical protein